MIEINVIELLGGIVIGGAAGVYAKDKLFGESSNSSNKQQELNTLYAENEKYRKRNQELERQVEDLLADLKKLQRKAKETDDGQDNLEDELDKANRTVKSLRTQNEELSRKVKEYKTACEALEIELTNLKNKTI